MYKIFKYSLFDLSRSKMIYFYTLFFLLAGFALLYLNNDLMTGITNLMNISLLICPLISIIFGVTYFYNSRDFIELLLAQPISRKKILLGKYFGLSITLSLSYFIGTSIPFVLYGIFISNFIFDFITLLLSTIILTYIFSGIAFLITLMNDNKIKGFGYAIFIWLFMAFLYDGLFLLALFVFNEYPIESFSIFMTLLNPIDLARILVMLKLDAAAMLGYTGAVFNKFLGSSYGIILASLSLFIWTLIPILLSIMIGRKKDF